MKLHIYRVGEKPGKFKIIHGIGLLPLKKKRILYLPGVLNVALSCLCHSDLKF
jgi:hypothetical protein